MLNKYQINTKEMQLRVDQGRYIDRFCFRSDEIPDPFQSANVCWLFFLCFVNRFVKMGEGGTRNYIDLVVLLQI